MEQVFAINLCRPVGPTLTTVIVSVMPNSFSSVKNTVNFHTSPRVRAFNFANLNNLAPASVALAEFGCKPYERRPLSDCLPILEHRPWLAVPDEVLWLHPDWSTCVPSLVGLSCALTCPGAISPHNSGCCSSLYYSGSYYSASSSNPHSHILHSRPFQLFQRGNLSKVHMNLVLKSLRIQ